MIREIHFFHLHYIVLFSVEIHLFDFSNILFSLDFSLGCLVTATFLELIEQLVSMKKGWMAITSDIGITLFTKLPRLSMSTTCSLANLRVVCLLFLAMMLVCL